MTETEKAAVVWDRTAFSLNVKSIFLCVQKGGDVLYCKVGNQKIIVLYVYEHFACNKSREVTGCRVKLKLERIRGGRV